MNGRQTVLIVFGFLLLAGHAWPSVVDPRKGQRPVPEQSQETLARQQAFQGTFDEVGLVPRDTEVPAQQRSASSERAAGVIAGEAAAGAGGNAAAASKVVAEARAAAPAGEGGFLGTLGLGVLFLAMGFGVVMGLRHYVAKSIPAAAAPRRIEW